MQTDPSEFPIVLVVWDSQWELGASWPSISQGSRSHTQNHGTHKTFAPGLCWSIHGQSQAWCVPQTWAINFNSLPLPICFTVFTVDGTGFPALTGTAGDVAVLCIPGWATSFLKYGNCCFSLRSHSIIFKNVLDNK